MAQDLGIYNSIKGVGLTLQLPSGGSEFDAFTVITEVYGIPTGRTEKAGVKFNYSHNIIFHQTEFENALLSFYAGPGVSAGYLRDAELGIHENHLVPLKHKPGFMLALSGTVGSHLHFSRKLSLDISLTADLGIHMRRDETLNSIGLNLYKNGIFQALYPQLSILYSL